MRLLQGMHASTFRSKWRASKHFMDLVPRASELTQHLVAYSCAVSDKAQLVRTRRSDIKRRSRRAVFLAWCSFSNRALGLFSRECGEWFGCSIRTLTGSCGVCTRNKTAIDGRLGCDTER